MGEHDRRAEDQPSGVFVPRDDGGVVETTEVDSRTVLERLERLDIHEWTCISKSGLEVTHLGPAAEEFHEVFDLSEDAERIATGDADGVALTVVKELADRLDEQTAVADRHERRIERQQQTIADQRDDIETLRESLESIQTTVARLRRQIDDCD